jgi:dihydroorotate dehydrogenase (NAD+) catalytic subunit
MNPLATRLKHLALRSPLLTASGTSGSSDETAALAGSGRILRALGAFVTKGVTLRPRPGNPEPRVIEARAGLLNSIGLQNGGIAAFMRHDLPKLRAFQLPVFVNISAGSVAEFGELTRQLVQLDRNETVAGLEINVSCPNIAAGGAAFGADPAMVEKIARTVRRHARPGQLLIVKLSPNVTSIVEPARAAIAGGADALSMINTLRGTAIDIGAQSFALGNRVGGLSGPAVKPVGLYMVGECYRAIPACRDGRVPIIGIGGVATWEDALEYILAGASAVGIGTAWLVDPDVFPRIRTGLRRYCREQRTTLAALVGRAHQTETRN